MSGYIKLFRQLQDHQIWTKQRFTMGQAWVDLILQAEFQDKTLIVEFGKYKVPRGSFVTSQRKLSKRWRWGIANVNRFLVYLSKTERQIEHKTEHNFTHIFILNYNKFQGSVFNKAEHFAEQKVELERNTSRTRAETNKEVKEVKEVKEEVNREWARTHFSKPTPQEIRLYFKTQNLKGDPGAFYDHYESNGWKVGGKAAMKDWQATARNWSRRETARQSQEQGPFRPAEPGRKTITQSEYAKSHGGEILSPGTVICGLTIVAG